MKRNLISVLVLVVSLSLISISQSRDIPDGFIGLKWGHSLNKMREKKLLSSVKIDAKNPDEVMAILDLKRLNPFPDLKVKGIALRFYKGKLYGGTIIIDNYKDWNLLSKTLKKKYGDPSTEKMKNVNGKSIGTYLTWDFGTGKGVLLSGFNQPENEGTISYFFPPKELMDGRSSQEKKDRSKVKDKL